MTEFAAYLAGLLVAEILVLVTAYSHRGQATQMLRTMAAIALNWQAGVAYIAWSGDYTPWMFNIAIDALAAFAVMFHPAGKVQGFIGLFYFVQIAGHIAYGGRRLFDMSADDIYYYDALTYVAWAQLIAMGVWCGGVWIGSAVHRVRDCGHADDRRTSAATAREEP